MARFELISQYEGKDSNINLFPKRKTAESAGYDFFVAEDTVIPPMEDHSVKIMQKVLQLTEGYVAPITLDDMAALTKELKAKPTLVPTGVKAKLNSGTYLELSVRSSCPLKYWLILANGVGIIDADYYNNPDNEGHIYFQFINLSPVPIQLKAGDCIGQGIIKSYLKTGEDYVKDAAAARKRTGGFGSTDNA